MGEGSGEPGLVGIISSWQPVDGKKYPVLKEIGIRTPLQIPTSTTMTATFTNANPCGEIPLGPMAPNKNGDAFALRPLSQIGPTIRLDEIKTRRFDLYEEHHLEGWDEDPLEV